MKQVCFLKCSKVPSSKKLKSNSLLVHYHFIKGRDHMKLLHISDLHLGKRVNEFSMIEDQEYILRRIINIIDEEKPDGLLIAGDVYDKSVPSEDAVRLLDEFLAKIAKRKLQTFIISGNHDSAVKLSFASKIIDVSGIHISPVYNGEVKPISLEDEYGKVNIYMLPFIKPVNVRAVFPDEEIADYTDACRVAIDHMGVERNERNVLVAHQFVTGAERSESEEISVGGLDNVDASVFDDFDYVALGHIHGPQRIKRDTIRYSGTPLKYSFSEARHHKSVTVVEIGEKEDGDASGDCVKLRTIDLVPKHDMRQIRGTYLELTDKKNYENTAVDDYLHVTLTDEEDIMDAMAKLRLIYPNIMKLSYDNRRTQSTGGNFIEAEVEKKSPLELFEEFYEAQNNQPMSEEQREFTRKLIEEVWTK